ncbi:hypothetical protein K227x_52240 [Rubripirellula lacrimiformis]|uniref:Uncharacterized protein n=1 Tax=Rubripirellula lacrimiformis TaxID=1930273 RepID=A0A517NI96_9BACT|nr:hypothetical protein K227x_52240 [Rubripirellula lacrimiformis]
MSANVGLPAAYENVRLGRGAAKVVPPHPSPLPHVEREQNSRSTRGRGGKTSWGDTAVSWFSFAPSPQPSPPH